MLYFYSRYWGPSDCPDGSPSGGGETAELHMENVAGIFFILVGGVVFSLLVCFLARIGHVVNKKKTSMEGNIPNTNHDSGIYNIRYTTKESTKP